MRAARYSELRTRATAARRKWRCCTLAASKPPGPAAQPATRTGPAPRRAAERAGSSIIYEGEPVLGIHPGERAGRDVPSPAAR
jgi:hypothetical protein